MNEVFDGGANADVIVAVVNQYRGQAEKVVRGPYLKPGVDAEDEPSYPLLPRHSDEVRIINELPPVKISIHCFEGRNRSVTMCVGLLLVEERQKLSEILR